MRHFIISRIQPTEVTNEIVASAVKAPISRYEYEIDSYYYDNSEFLQTVEIKVTQQSKLTLTTLRPHKVKEYVEKGYMIKAFTQSCHHVDDVLKIACANDPTMYERTIIAVPFGFLLCNIETVYTYPEGVKGIDVYTLEG